MTKFVLLAGVAGIAAQIALAPIAHAESNLAPAAGSAGARVDFQIKIPKVLFLRVGIGANSLASDSRVDLIDFNVAAADVGNSVAQSATAASGDLGYGSVIVALFANGGNSATLNSHTTGQMTNGAGDTIPWSEIAVNAQTLPFGVPSPLINTVVSHPAFNDTPGGGDGSQVTVSAATGHVVAVAGRWTFSYKNSQPVTAGSYGGVGTQNGRVTYTAAQP